MPGSLEDLKLNQALNSSPLACNYACTTMHIGGAFTDVGMKVYLVAYDLLLHHTDCYRNLLDVWFTANSSGPSINP